MTSLRYLRETIAISVYPEMRSGRMSLTCADEQAQESLAMLLEHAALTAPADVDAMSYARAKVEALFANNFADDVWYSQAPGLPPVLLVKKSVIEGVMSLEDAVRCTHQALVTQALQDGLPVPPAVYAEYRSMFQLDNPDARELQF